MDASLPTAASMRLSLRTLRWMPVDARALVSVLGSVCWRFAFSPSRPGSSLYGTREVNVADVVRPPTRQETLDLLSGLRAAFLYGYFIEAVARRHCEDIPNEARAAKEFVFEGRSGERTALKLDLVAEWLENQENGSAGRP